MELNSASLIGPFLIIGLLVIMKVFHIKPDDLSKKKPKQLLKFSTSSTMEEIKRRIVEFAEKSKYKLETQSDEDRCIILTTPSVFENGLMYPVYYYPIYYTPLENGEILIEVGIKNKTYQGLAVYTINPKKLKEFYDQLKKKLE